MQGYKIFDADWTCRGLQYALGETTRHSGDLVPCKSGLHFCETALACTAYYELTAENRYAAVRAGRVVQKNDKWVTDELTVVRELTFAEFRALCTGVRQEWYPDGQLEVEATYREGQLEGVHRQWYPDGQLREEATYREDRLEGVRRQWYSSGRLREKATYRDGRLEGVRSKWHYNSQLWLEATYRAGLIEGLHREWYFDGKLKEDATYRAGRLDELRVL